MTRPLTIYGGRWDGLTVMPPKPLPRLAVTFLMADSNTLDHDAGYTLAERISEDSRDVTLMIVGSSLIETGSPDAA